MYHITLPLVHTCDIIWPLPVPDNRILVTPIGVINFHQHHWLDPGSPFWLVLTQTCVQPQKNFRYQHERKNSKWSHYISSQYYCMMGLKRPSLSNLRAIFSNDKLLRQSGSKIWWYLVIACRHSCGSCCTKNVSKYHGSWRSSRTKISFKFS